MSHLAHKEALSSLQFALIWITLGGVFFFVGFLTRSQLQGWLRPAAIAKDGNAL